MIRDYKEASRRMEPEIVETRYQQPRGVVRAERATAVM